MCTKGPKPKRAIFAKIFFFISRLKKDHQKLEKVQRRATKCLTGLKDCSYSERLVKLKLPSLSYRRYRADLIQTFKIVKGLEDIQPSTFFKFSSHGKTRGHKYDNETTSKSKQTTELILTKNDHRMEQSSRLCSKQLVIKLIQSQPWGLRKHGEIKTSMIRIKFKPFCAHDMFQLNRTAKLKSFFR